MRESLTKSKKGKTKKKKASVSVSKTKAKKATTPAKVTKAVKSSKSKTIKASSRPKAKVTPKKVVSVSRKTVKAKKLTVKPAAKTTTAKTTKAKVVSKKVAVKSPKVKTVSRRINEIKPSPRILRVRPALVTPVPAETVQKPISPAALRSFEQAVKSYNRHNYAESKNMFEALQRKYPTEVEIIAGAQTYVRVCSKKLSEASTQPRNADDYYDRGVYALNIGNFSEAASFFEKALGLRPDEPHLLYTLAATHAQTGSLDQALDYLKRSIQIQPKFRTQALNDADFSELKENRQFLELMGLISPFERFQSRY